MLIKFKIAVVVLAVLSCFVTPRPSNAANFLSFTGAFIQDDEVQLFDFVVTETTAIVFRSWSYAGGVNAAGQVIPAGGFDVILSVFDINGNLLGFNDDGGTNVPDDPATGVGFDAFLALTLGPGDYKVAVT